MPNIVERKAGRLIAWKCVMLTRWIARVRSPRDERLLALIRGHKTFPMQQSDWLINTL